MFVFLLVFFFKSGYIILFTVPELIRLYTYLSHLSSEKCQGTNSLCGQILPQELYKIRKPAPLKNQRDRGMQATRISNQNSLLGRTPNSATWLTNKKGMGWNQISQTVRTVCHSMCLEICSGLINIISLRRIEQNKKLRSPELI